MTLRSIILALFILGSFFYAFGVNAGQQVALTVSAPLQIPGSVLFPGTYIFKIVQSDPDRRIIQVFDERESMVFSTFIAVPNRRRSSEVQRLEFANRPMKKFPAVKAMSFPNERYLLQFVYDKDTASELAKDVNEAVLWTDAKNDQLNEMKLASIRSVDINGISTDRDVALQTTFTDRASHTQ
jgi:hypothetical protein